MNMKRNRIQGKGGFTLLEVLMAMVILGIWLLGIVRLQMTSSLGNVTARNVTAATNLARNKLEEFRLVRSYYITETGGTTVTMPDLVDPDSGGGNDLGNWSSPDHEDGGSMDENGNPGGIFRRAWNVVDNMPDTTIKTVRVRVAWEQGGQPRFVDLEMQVSRRNLDFY